MRHGVALFRPSGHDRQQARLSRVSEARSWGAAWRLAAAIRWVDRARRKCFLLYTHSIKPREGLIIQAVLRRGRVTPRVHIRSQADGSASGSVVAGMVSGTGAAWVCAPGVGGAAAGAAVVLKWRELSSLRGEDV